jgi:exodeoxyribonuclease VII large subunit
MQNDSTHKIYTVSEINAEIKTLLESNFPFIWINAEISNFRQPISGHYYFTLKDDGSQIQAVMFRGQQKHLKYRPEDGMTVTGMGRLSVYEPRGSYQIILEYMEPSGIGALQMAFEKRKQQLAAEGLFDAVHKKELPLLPQTIAVLTSPSGAVVHDILQIVDRRFPNIEIEIIPVKVQGPGAEDEIINALKLLNVRNTACVAILARGGGSLEDLQAFNSEPVARAIFRSQIPVVSAVGHETDYTLADFVADLRAPTPSAAAELIVPEKSDLIRRVHSQFDALIKYFNNHIKVLRTDLDLISRRLVDPRKSIPDFRLEIDDLAARLCQQAVNYLNLNRERLGWWNARLNANSPANRVDFLKVNIEKTFYNLLKTYNIYFDNKRAALRECRVRLNALSPVAILNRGYSITRSIPDAAVVTDPVSVSVEQDVEVLLARGRLFCRVKGKSPNGKENLRTIDETA